MWLKIIGSAFILLAGSLIGFRIAGNFLERPRQLRQVINILVSLKSQINYASCPLPEALAKCSGGIYGPVAFLFQNAGDILNEKGWLSPKEALEISYEEAKDGLAFKKPELEIIGVLFANLGSADKAEQQKNISMIEYQLGQIQIEAEKIASPQVKMYRYLGICGSIAVIIILI